jgi:hypothetical protein
VSQQGESQPDSSRVEHLKGAVVVFTPCHQARVLFPPDQAIPGEKLDVVCPRDGVDWCLELVADQTAEGGLRAVWTIPKRGR